MGQRFRLKAGYDISGFSPEVRVILTALKRYGMVLADNGAPWYLSGSPDPRWDNDRLHELERVPGSAFEAVDCSGLMIQPDSARARFLPGTPVPVRTATLTPTRAPVHLAAISGFQPPNDPDSNGIFEDTDGNGVLSDFDVGLAFTHINQIRGGLWPVSSLDLDRNGKLELYDLYLLYLKATR
jgi:hypothetical protein